MNVNRLALLFLAIGASIAIVACPDAANVDNEGGGTPTPAPQPTPPSTTPTPEPPASMGVVRQYLPRLSGAEIGDDWSMGETARTLVLLSGNLDDAERTLQVHDKGYRHGEWTALDQYRFEIPMTSIVTCHHLYSGRSEEPARQDVRHIFTLTGRITNEDRPMTYAELTLKWDGEPSFSCPEDYAPTTDGDDSWKVAPWEEVTDQVATWHWRAKAVNPTPSPAPRLYLPRQSGATVDGSWNEEGMKTRKLKLDGNLDDADRTLQVHDNGYRVGEWIDLGQATVDFVSYARTTNACSHVYSAKSEEAVTHVTHLFMLSGHITNRSQPEDYAEFTLTYSGVNPPRCEDDYNYTGIDEAPWDDAIAEVKKWHWRAKAVDR